MKCGSLEHFTFFVKHVNVLIPQSIYKSLFNTILGPLLLETLKLKLPIPHVFKTLPSCSVQGLAKRPASQTACVKAFFIHLYWTAGESMTTKKLGLMEVDCLFEIRNLQLLKVILQTTTRNTLSCDWKNDTIAPRIGSESMLSTSDEDLRSDLLRRLVAQSLLGFLDH